MSQQQQKNRIAQSIVNVIALLMVLGGLYLIFSQKDLLLGSFNVILGGSLFSTEKWRRER